MSGSHAQTSGFAGGHDSKVNVNHLDEIYKNLSLNENEEGNIYAIPDGDYVVQVEKVKLDRCKNGTPAFKWTLKVISKDYEGEILYRQNTLNGSEATLQQLKNDLDKCGIKISSISDLQKQEIIKKFTGMILQIRLVSKEGKGSIHILRRIRENVN